MSKFYKKQELLKRAIALYNKEYKLSTISRELDIHPSTLRKWLRDEGYKPKKNPHGANPKQKEEKVEEPKQELSALEAESSKEDEALKKANDLQITYEDTYVAAEQALNPSSANDQNLIRGIDRSLHRFNKNAVIKTWKEAEIASRIKRDIQGKTNAVGSVHVDVSILNKTKTLETDAKIIDVEPVDENKNE